MNGAVSVREWSSVLGCKRVVPRWPWFPSLVIPVSGPTCVLARFDLSIATATPITFAGTYSLKGLLALRCRCGRATLASGVMGQGL